MDLSALDLWCKVDNENFAENLLYRAVAYLDYGETATGQLLFVTDEGAFYALPVTHVRCLRGHERLSRAMRADEEDVPMWEEGEIASFAKGGRRG